MRTITARLTNIKHVVEAVFSFYSPLFWNKPTEKSKNAETQFFLIKAKKPFI